MATLRLFLTYFEALQAIYPSFEWKTYKHHLPIRGSKSQALLFDMVKRLLPETPISSNTSIPSDNIKLAEEERLRVYEFDVSFLILSI
jgi:hypothetical protein